MKLYNFAVGFKRARKEAGYTQESFVKSFLNQEQHEITSLKSVRNWEQGLAVPEIKTIEKLCLFFKCDMDYLFGNINCKTHDKQFIHDYTGLSERAIDKLEYYNSHLHEYTEALDILLASANFESALSKVKKYMKAVELTDGLTEIRRKRREEVFSKQPDGENGSYNWAYSDNLDKLWSDNFQKEELLEYNLDTYFRYLIQELARLAGRKK